MGRNLYWRRCTVTLRKRYYFMFAAFEKDGMASIFASSSIVLYYFLKRNLEKYIEIGLT